MWILVFRISLDVDSGFVTRDSWILGRSGGARDPAEVVRERRQRLRHRLRRRLGHAMGRVRHSDTCAFCALCAPLGADFAAGVGHSARAAAPWVGLSGLQMRWKGTPGFSKGESWIPAGTRGTPGSRSCRRVPLESDVNFQLKQSNRGFSFSTSHLIWILASPPGIAGFRAGRGSPGSCRSRHVCAPGHTRAHT